MKIDGNKSTLEMIKNIFIINYFYLNKSNVFLKKIKIILIHISSAVNYFEIQILF